MSSRSLLACSLLSLAALSGQSASAALIAHYTFDETSGTTATDSVSGANGAIGTNVTLGTTGKYGTAFTFNNDATQAGIVDMGNATPIFNAINTSQTVTISVWMNWSSSTDNRDTVVFLGDSNTSTSYVDLGTLGGTNTANLGGVYGRTRVSAAQDLLRGSGFNNGAWHHIAYTVNAATDTTQLYIDGSLVGTITTPAFAFQTFNNFEVGRLGRSAPVDGFTGSVDDLRIYDTVLTGGEIATLAAVPEPSAALLGGLGVLGLLRRRRA